MNTPLSHPPTASHFPSLQRTELETVQANLGYRCNQACRHCHVDAGPARTEAMDLETVNCVLQFLAESGATTLDLTGGAPELNPHFRHMVIKARELGVRVIDRCNLTVLEEPGFEDLAAFLADWEVEIIASLPCYLEDNVDRQRGRGVFQASIRALRRLNELGYAGLNSNLRLNLVYNPQGARLPPSQSELEAAYRDHLQRHFGIQFTCLYALANMPIQRFAADLSKRGELDRYMKLLRESYREENLPAVMCRSLVSIGWDGTVYDCDFNQMLELPLGRRRTHVRNLTTAALQRETIVTAGHCFGCTAGSGSSCGGALNPGPHPDQGAQPIEYKS